MNDTTMMRFRESFRGYNKDDVNAYIEQIHMKFSRREAELRAQMAELQNTPCRSAAHNEAVAAELEAAKLALSRVEAENRELKSMMEASKTAMVESNTENAEKSKLYDSMSAQVGNILIVANSNADKIVADAKADAEKLKADATFEAEKTKREAEEKMNAMVAALEMKLKAVSDQCLSEYETLVTEARVRFSEISDTMKSRSEELLAAADRKSRELELQIASEYYALEVE